MNDIETRIAKLEAAAKALLEKYNHCHNASDGRFCSAPGVKASGSFSPFKPKKPKATAKPKPKAPAKPPAPPPAPPKPPAPAPAPAAKPAGNKLHFAASGNPVWIKETIAAVESKAPGLVKKFNDLGLKLKLFVTNGTTATGGKAVGTYNLTTKGIAIAGKPKVMGSSLESGAFSTAAVGKNTTEVRRNILIHEMSHQVDHAMGGSPGWAMLMYSDKHKYEINKGNGITKYAKVNTAEYFAETSAAYFIAPATLKAKDLAGFNMMRSVYSNKGRS